MNINFTWAQDEIEIQVSELLQELRALEATVNRQEKRIAELEARLSKKEKGQFPSQLPRARSRHPSCLNRSS